MGDGRRPDAPTVTVLEASARLGGPLQSQELGGRVVDVGPDGFLGRRRAAVDLRREVGRADTLVPIAARGASARSRGRLRPLPEGTRSGSRHGSGPRPARASWAWRGTLGLARDAGATPARHPRADRRPFHRAPRGAQARSACRRHAGRSAHRRHPCRFGRRHVRRGDVPAAAGGRPTQGRPHAGVARRGARARPRRAATLLVARRGHGVARPRGAVGLRERGVDVRLSAPADRTGHREDGP